MSNDGDARPLRSFGRTQGRKLRAGAQTRVQELLPKLALNPDALRNDPGALAGITAERPLALEIGFGGGEHLAAQVRMHLEIFFIGCEPYLNGVANCLKLLEPSAPTHLRLYQGDARDLIGALLDACLDRVFILFPDPWPKARHHKRRLIQLPFLESLARVMKPGAELRLATDHEDYLNWMLEVLLQSPHFRWTATRAADWTEPPAGWVRTGYQEWAEGEGRVSTYLTFVRSAS